MDSQSRCVVVTGFGPFRQHLVNSSWEAVKELSKLGLGVDTDIELRTLQLPVDYREVKRRLTTIWEEFQPQEGLMVIHPGLVHLQSSLPGAWYICDYTYYLSLHLGTGHAALIHVPPLSHWLSASLLGKALQAIIQEMLEGSRKVQTQSTAA
ncbi:pyroglutamyl-peptidase 1-like protein [Mus pahari]|uniref:pyroglutamyl-peptidase 1-like protein n=1 Tax=Mus pahari TaxID=10093 RepID=UPI001114B8A3|nr:pyroglutamyl-peptidase 1-like protein [Mus pahari]